MYVFMLEKTMFQQKFAEFSQFSELLLCPITM